MRKLKVDGKPIDVAAHLETLITRLGTVRGLAAVYLYGSYGTPYQTPLSDVDLAVVFRSDAVPDLREQIDLINLITDALHEDDVSVTVLNHAPLAFQFKVLREGRPLLVQDALAVADFKERVIDLYGDFSIDYRRFLEEYDRALLEEYGGPHAGS